MMIFRCIATKPNFSTHNHQNPITESIYVAIKYIYIIFIYDTYLHKIYIHAFIKLHIYIFHIFVNLLYLVFRR